MVRRMSHWTAGEAPMKQVLRAKTIDSVKYESTLVSGQFITTSAEVTPNGGLVRESPQKMALN